MLSYESSELSDLAVEVVLQPIDGNERIVAFLSIDMDVVLLAVMIVDQHAALRVLNPGQPVFDAMGSPFIRPNQNDLPIDEAAVLQINAKRRTHSR